MEGMAEHYFPGSGETECYIFHAAMASVTAAGNAESDSGIMAGATGTILLHISHGISATQFTPGKYSAVAVRADIHIFCRIGVDSMTEDCRGFCEAYIRFSQVTFLAITTHRESFP